MNRKIPLIAFVALSGALAAGLAQARDADLRWSVTIGAPIVVPGVVSIHAPPPAYAPPPVAYGPPAGYGPPPPAYGRPARGPSPAYVAYRQPTRWDVDGDGIPNRYDRLYNPRWDVDGDGIPNRHDRHFNPWHDGERDGMANRHDRWSDAPGRGRGHGR